MSVTVTIPTASSIKMRFPEFADVDDAVIEFAIEEARLEVGTNWTSGQNVAIVYLTAHYVACSVSTSLSGGTGDTGPIASESIGRLSISYQNNGNGAVNAVQGDKSSTSYGRRFNELLGRNFGGPVVI
jgi:hypothetical protein